MTLFAAENIARGWLAVALASAKDDDRPALNRTVSIESYPFGVRLAATDGYILLHSWIPTLESTDPEPEPDEVPVSTAIAMDPHGRARGFLAHVLKLATAKDAEPIEVRLRMGVVLEPDAETTPSFDGLEAQWVVLEHPDHEKIMLRVYEGEFPSWRKVLDGFRAEKTDAIALNPELVGRLVKLGRFFPERPLLWRFGGRDRMALVEVGGSDPFVTGAAMPVRWDFDRDAPLEEPDKDPEVA